MEKFVSVDEKFALIAEMFRITASDLGTIFKRLEALEHPNSTPTQTTQEETIKPVSEERYSPIIYRHERRHDEEGIAPRGGIVYAFKIDYLLKRCYVGMAVCSEKENFRKAFGAYIARLRCKEGSMHFPYESPSRTSLINSLWNAYNDELLVVEETEHSVLNAALEFYATMG